MRKVFTFYLDLCWICCFSRIDCFVFVHKQYVYLCLVRKVYPFIQCFGCVQNAGDLGHYQCIWFMLQVFDCTSAVHMHYSCSRFFISHQLLCIVLALGPGFWLHTSCYALSLLWARVFDCTPAVHMHCSCFRFLNAYYHLICPFGLRLHRGPITLNNLFHRPTCNFQWHLWL